MVEKSRKTPLQHHIDILIWFTPLTMHWEGHITSVILFLKLQPQSNYKQNQKNSNWDSLQNIYQHTSKVSRPLKSGSDWEIILIGRGQGNMASKWNMGSELDLGTEKGQ